MVALSLLVFVAVLAIPYWMGKQTERKYAEYLQQLDDLAYLEVLSSRYERHWFSARASYDLALSSEFETLVKSLFPAWQLPNEALLVSVSDRIQHGPFNGGMARVEGHVGFDGGLLASLVEIEAQTTGQGYRASIGYDQVLRGHWEPMHLAVTAAPEWRDMGWDARYVMDYEGGDFSYDPGTGEYHTTGRMKRMLMEDPTGVRTTEDSTSEVVARFSDGTLRELRLESHDSLVLNESRDALHPSRITGQSTFLGVYFDDDGRVERFESQLGMDELDTAWPNGRLQADGVSLAFEGTREGEHAWFGSADLGLDAIVVKEQGVPSISLNAMKVSLGLEPEADDALELVAGMSARDIRFKDMDEPVAYDYQLRMGQLRRSAYDDLWQLFYRAVDEFQLEHPEVSPVVLERMNEAAMALVGDRLQLSAKPVQISMGEAGLNLELDASIPVDALMVFGASEQALLMSDSQVELSADVSADLIHKMAREYLRHDYNEIGYQASDKELTALAKEMVSTDVDALLKQGIILQEGDGHYSTHFQLEGHELTVNGEPADWLLERL
ncbi:hypothetical protein L861_13225 [Litchfieldella anticariensis FP35 = DSM 16096]|uniref:DUF945 domain-containing protein n=1 Tax=Litchfieldella anticariensis (strain DSM 16096 / CECT 5854 / CIP 108499 / LMG 22089 / FP35) TaxID=1121939 RepID=S2KF10_LITA3|nr:hypothetical protein L861_13225 [Halomonas anticariensis FP35 = DSM 16096]